MYSQVKENARNQADYWFSLNPEAIPGAHLYPVWALLQKLEVEARVRASLAEAAARPGFGERADGKYLGQFRYPWFDGGTYLGTIVVTPADGTWIAEAGTRNDLSDDTVVQAVVRYFESTQWTGKEELRDFAASKEVADVPAQKEHVLTAPRALGKHAYRVVTVAMRSDAQLFESRLGYNVAQRLWRTLAPGTQGVPLDFEQRHVVTLGEAAGCWNRHGIAVAYLDNEAGRHVRDQLADLVKEMAGLSCEITAVAGADGNKRDVTVLRSLLDTVAGVKWRSAQPEVKLARRFFDAIGFEKQLSLVHELYHAEASRKSLHDMAALQRTAAVLEILILAVYALEAAHLFTANAHETHFGLTLSYLVGAPILIGGATAWLHTARHKHGRVLNEAGILGLLFILLIGAGTWLAVVAHRATEREKQQQKEEVRNKALENTEKEEGREREWRLRFEELQKQLGQSQRAEKARGPNKP